VHTQKNVWICHSQSCVAARGGQAGGNVLDFVAAMEQCSIVEAARRLGARFGLGGLMPTRPESTGFKENEGGMGPWVGLPTGDQNPRLPFVLRPVDCQHAYLRQRGIDRQTAEYFQVGFYSGRGMMQGRIVIPIHNREGQLVGYAGRVIDRSEPRYRFPRGFHKAVVLFNLHRALRSGSPEAIVVEGFFDCLRVHQAGFPQVVAFMGSWLSQAQQEGLVAHFQKLVVMLDGDQAGRQATQQIIRRLGSKIPLRWAVVPTAQQPDQLPVAEIRRLVEKATNCSW
jgi:DNA primase